MLWSIHYIRLYCLLQKAYLSLMAPSDFSAESHPPWPHMRISRHESDMAASAWPSPVHNDFFWEFPCKRFLWFFNADVVLNIFSHNRQYDIPRLFKQLHDPKDWMLKRTRLVLFYFIGKQKNLFLSRFFMLILWRLKWFWTCFYLHMHRLLSLSTLNKTFQQIYVLFHAGCFFADFFTCITFDR